VKRIVLYGATGFTGGLIVAEACRLGVPLVLAGRDTGRLARLAEPLGLSWIAAEVGGAEALFSEPCVLLNCAGPFSRTQPLAEAAIAAGCDYVDICGEADMLAATRRLDESAQAAGAILLPGAGFDIVPSDCLLAHLKLRLGDIDAVDLGFRLPAAMSRGTLKMMAEAATAGVAVLDDGRIRNLAGAELSVRARLRFQDGEKVCAPVRWGDVATAGFSVGARRVRAWLGGTPYRMLAPMSPILGTGRPPPRAVQAIIDGVIGALPEGPGPAARRKAACHVAAMATSADGRRAAAAMVTPDAYVLTAATALDAAVRVARGEVSPGFQTPSTAFGADYALAFGCSRRDFDAAI
jgi:short subunit dehydrogenase-like uncharacterized protein